MAALSAAQRTQIYNELTEATSEDTAEVIVQSVIDVQWDTLVTNDHLDAGFAQVGARFAQVGARFAQVDSRFAQVDSRFARLEGQVDARFAQVDSRFARLEGQLDARFAQIDARFAEVREQSAQTDAKIERTARNMTIWLMSTTLAFNGLLAAWLTAVH
ncbi:MAG TPA: hypothetical protein VFN21_01165 [Acidimicrobiales bacterium]|nr:hypothetical protein [Acidimicrobiales bacterium]